MNRAEAVRSRKPPRDPIDYAIEELEWRRDTLLELAPATDNAAFMLWKVRALEEAIERLRQPHFEINPFV